MMKIFLQLILICIMSMTVGTVVLAQQSGPAFPLLNPDLEEQIDYLSDDSASAYNPATDKTTMAQIVADVIKVFLGLLGVIFAILIILAGYNYMTAAGNDEKVTKAQNLMSRAVIGLIIIVTAYAITYWVFARLPS